MGCRDVRKGKPSFLLSERIMPNVYKGMYTSRHMLSLGYPPGKSKERLYIMKKIAILSVLCLIALLPAYSYGQLNFVDESSQVDTAQFIQLLDYIDNGEEQMAKDYIAENNITQDELSFYMIASPDVMPQIYDLEYIIAEAEGNEGGLLLGGLDVFMAECSKRLAFFLQNGADAFRYHFTFNEQSYSFPDYLAVSALAAPRDVMRLAYLFLGQLDIVHEMSNEFRPERNFKDFHDLGILDHTSRFYLGDDESYDVIAKLIDYFGCGPSEEIFLAMLNHNYDTEWLELDISLGNSWVEDGFDFSVSAADSFASTMEEYFDGENYFRGLDPDGSLKLLSDMGFDFEEDSYAILFSAIQDKNLSAEEIKYVIEQQVAWNARNDDGETLLMHIAAYTEPDKGLVEFMLDGGADIARLSRDRESVLIFASKEFAPLENIHTMIAEGADVLSKNKNGYNAISILFRNAAPSRPYNPLFPTGGNFDFVDDYFCPLLQLLIDAGVPLNDQDNFRWTIAGLIARSRNNAYYSNDDVFELLYENGLDFTAKSQGRSVSQIISGNGNTKLEDFLQDKGLL